MKRKVAKSNTNDDDDDDDDRSVVCSLLDKLYIRVVVAYGYV